MRGKLQFSIVIKIIIIGTHLFLSSEEIKNIKEYVPQAISGVSHLVIIENENSTPIAFTGIEDKK